MKTNKILIAADPLGKCLKDEVCNYLIQEGYEVTDIGSKEGVDVTYYEVGDAIGKCISKKEFERAIIFCGSGMGVNIVANKHEGVYCGLCETVVTAKLCRIINNCNVLSLGALTTTPFLANKMVSAFLETEFAKNFDLADETFLEGAFKEIQELEKEVFHDCISL